MENFNNEIDNFLFIDFFEDKPLTQVQKEGFKEVFLFEDVDSFLRDKVVDILAQNQEQPLTFLVDSGGGSVFDGTSIAALIRNHPQPTKALGMGIVASIATVILLSADEVQLDKDALFMIHNPYTSFTFGESKDLRKEADLLDKIRDQILNVYVSKAIQNNTEKTEEELRQQLKTMMKNETFLSAEEALEIGLIDSIVSKQYEEEERELTETQITALNNSLKSGRVSNFTKKIILNKIGMSNDKKPTTWDSIKSFFKTNPEKVEELKNEMEQENNNKLEAAKELLKENGYTIQSAEEKTTEEAQAQEAINKIETEKQAAEAEALEAQNKLEAEKDKMASLEKRFEELNKKVEASLSAPITAQLDTKADEKKEGVNPIILAAIEKRNKQS